MRNYLKYIAVLTLTVSYCSCAEMIEVSKEEFMRNPRKYAEIMGHDKDPVARAAFMRNVRSDGKIFIPSPTSSPTSSPVSSPTPSPKLASLRECSNNNSPATAQIKKDMPFIPALTLDSGTEKPFGDEKHVSEPEKVPFLDFTKADDDVQQANQHATVVINNNFSITNNSPTMQMIKIKQYNVTNIGSGQTVIYHKTSGDIGDAK